MYVVHAFSRCFIALSQIGIRVNDDSTCKLKSSITPANCIALIIILIIVDTCPRDFIIQQCSCITRDKDKCRLSLCACEILPPVKVVYLNRLQNAPLIESLRVYNGRT
jgi:hypothetical protein